MPVWIFGVIVGALLMGVVVSAFYPKSSPILTKVGAKLKKFASRFTRYFKKG